MHENTLRIVPSLVFVYAYKRENRRASRAFFLLLGCAKRRLQMVIHVECTTSKATLGLLDRG